MSVGLKIKGDLSLTQIDSQYKNYQFKTRGVKTFSNYLVSFSLEMNEILVIRSNRRIRKRYVKISGNTREEGYESYYYPTGKIEYFIYDFPIQNSGAVGLRVRNSEAEVVYNSNDQILKIMNSFFSYPKTWGSTGIRHRSFGLSPSENQYGILLMASGYGQSYHNDGNTGLNETTASIEWVYTTNNTYALSKENVFEYGFFGPDFRAGQFGYIVDLSEFPEIL